MSTTLDHASASIAAANWLRFAHRNGLVALACGGLAIVLMSGLNLLVIGLWAVALCRSALKHDRAQAAAAVVIQAAVMSLVIGVAALAPVKTTQHVLPAII